MWPHSVRGSRRIRPVTVSWDGQGKVRLSGNVVQVFSGTLCG